MKPLAILAVADLLVVFSDANAQVQMASSGSWAGGTPHMAPNGSWVGTND